MNKKSSILLLFLIYTIKIFFYDRYINLVDLIINEWIEIVEKLSITYYS